MLNVMSHAAAAGQEAAKAAKAGLNVDLIVNTVVQSLIFVGIGVAVFLVTFLLIVKITARRLS